MRLIPTDRLPPKVTRTSDKNARYRRFEKLIKEFDGGEHHICAVDIDLEKEADNETRALLRVTGDLNNCLFALRLNKRIHVRQRNKKLYLVKED